MAKTEDNNFTDILNASIRMHITDMIDQEVEAAIERVERKIKKEIGSIASSVMREFEVTQQQDYVTIRVKKENF